MNQGRIEQIASPAELRASPATPFVADFLGQLAGGPGVVPLRAASKSIASARGESTHTAR